VDSARSLPDQRHVGGLVEEDDLSARLRDVEAGGGGLEGGDEDVDDLVGLVQFVGGVIQMVML
jgi:hypothetical protein